MIYGVLGALLVGISLGLFGSGGSILTVPVLVYLLHHDEKIAIAESLVIVGSIALTSAIPYARKGAVDWRLAFLFGVPGMGGTFIGSWIAHGVDGTVQLLVFGGVMLLAAVSMWLRTRPGAHADTPEDAPPRRVHVVIAALQGVGVGLLTGFVGVGGGFLIVPALVLVGGLPMRRAVATSLVVISLNAATGLIKHRAAWTASGIEPAWGVMAMFIALGFVGGTVGRGVQSKINQRLLQRGFAVFLLLMAGFILVKESGVMGPAHENQKPAQAEGSDG